MAPSTDVTLPQHHKAVFPDLCIVCHGEPNGHARLVINTSRGWLGYFVPILWFFQWKRVDVPVCSSCKFSFYAQRWGRNVLMVALACIAIGFWWNDFRGLSRGERKLVLLGVGLAFLAPWIAIEVFWPRHFHLTASKHEVAYEFASPAYASAFAVANGLRGLPDHA
ncbi:MAG: hypothetical protein H6832_09560 [Planctomycetes bacterium]|nr:hypothetical protein [Planctomycetota bacterium]MCB9918637.1 hypothetical protein [Planctomycetota bacterium]